MLSIYWYTKSNTWN